jgi:hypothetical protein
VLQFELVTKRPSQMMGGYNKRSSWQKSSAPSNTGGFDFSLPPFLVLRTKPFEFKCKRPYAPARI